MAFFKLTAAVTRILAPRPGSGVPTVHPGHSSPSAESPEGFIFSVDIAGRIKNLAT